MHTSPSLSILNTRISSTYFPLLGAIISGTEQIDYWIGTFALPIVECFITKMSTHLYSEVQAAYFQSKHFNSRVTEVLVWLNNICAVHVIASFILFTRIEWDSYYINSFNPTARPNPSSSNNNEDEKNTWFFLLHFAFSLERKKKNFLNNELILT